MRPSGGRTDSRFCISERQEVDRRKEEREQATHDRLILRELVVQGSLRLFVRVLERGLLPVLRDGARVSIEPSLGGDLDGVSVELLGVLSECVHPCEVERVGGGGLCAVGKGQRLSGKGRF